MPDEKLKATGSFCGACQKSVPADVVKRNTSGNHVEIFLCKHCPSCGDSETKISSDARFYWLSHGRRNVEKNCGCGSCDCVKSADGENAGFPGRNAKLELPASKPLETLSTCLALIEIVDSCNLSCPTCFADSPIGTGQKVDAVPLAQIKARVQGVIDRKGPIEILQLSGGEPTLHPNFIELIEWCHTHEGIDYVLVNSNGIRLAGDREFGENLKEAAARGHFQFYLQFDGPEAEAEIILRGADLRKTKRRAIERALELGIPLTLAMTLIPENREQLWETVKFGLQYENVRGVAFQPRFSSGRVPSETRDHKGKLNTADLVIGLVEQSGGNLGYEDFTPLPCGDPNCATIGYLIKAGDEVKSISEFVDFETLQGFLGDRVRYNLEDLAKCGCESEPLGKLLHDLEMDERHTFRLFIKPFMDAEDWDQDRVDRCCTHVIRPDGELDSFCRYYLHGGASAAKMMRAATA